MGVIRIKKNSNKLIAIIINAICDLMSLMPSKLAVVAYSVLNNL